MIEECEDILECENKLSPIIQEISLLGEIPLSVEEVDKLGTFIKEQISDDIQKGTKFLKTETPTCVACFLVWKGILDYRGGDYWSAVKDSVGLSDPNWQGKWGKIFIDFLESNRLPSFDIKGAHRYVTPLLMHGMIPNSYLDEYFEKIIDPMVGKQTDPTDLKEISFLLGTQREDNEAIKTIEEEIEKLQDNKKQISSKLIKYRSLIKIWDDLDEIKTLEREVGDHGELASLPEDPLEYKNKKNSEIQGTQKRIEELENKERLCEQQRNKFSELDKKILSDLEAIDRCSNILPGLEHELGELTEIKTQENLLKNQMEECAHSIFSERWDERYVPSIRELPFDDLKDKIEAFNSRRISESQVRQGHFENILKIIEGWADYFFSRSIKRERTSQEIQVEISEILKDFPIDERVIERPQPELVHNLKQLCDDYVTIRHLRETKNSVEKKNNEQINRIESAAQAVGVDITGNVQFIIADMRNKLADAQRNKQTADQAEQQIKEIENNIRELTAEKDALFEELQEIDERLAKLGNGDVQFGVEQLKQRRDAQLKAQSLRNNLMRRYPDLGSLEREKDEAQRNGTDESYYISEKDSSNVKFEQIKQEIAELVEELKQIQIPFSSVDEPTRRFLLYGGDAASDFLVQSVQMMNQTEKEKNAPSADEIGLPERVVTRFEEWWGGFIIIDGDKEEDVIKEQEIFRIPVIYLDTALSEIEVHFPPQRISGETARLCLVINEDKPDSHKEPLKVYRYDKDLLETEELDFSLPFPSNHYEFTLKNDNQVIERWDIQGISPDRPFMAFNYDSKKLIKEEELPREQIWILLHDGFNLEPSRSIIEEAYLREKWREHKYRALDLSDVNQLDLVDKQGEKKSIPISREKILEPTLYSEPLIGCRSEEGAIYVGEPPSILVPIKSDTEISGWIISIPKSNANTLDESKHYRLTDEEIFSIDEKENVLKISLSDEKYMGKTPVGRFTVRLRNNVRHIDKSFSFCVVPHLTIGFDKDIYLPCESDTSQVYLRLGVSDQMEFESQSPAKIIGGKDRSYRIKTASSEHNIHGILRYPPSDSDLITIPITIGIPRLTWRLDGLPGNKYSSESNRMEEIWIGDLEKAGESLSLIVSMPHSICGQGQLSLCNSEQGSETKITEGKAIFNLLRFSDTLKGSDESLQTFELTVPDSETSIDHVPLFRIRTIWGVEDLKCKISMDDEARILNIWWGEKGKAENRVVRLWGLKSGEAIYEEQIMKDRFSVTIAKPIKDIPDGRYLIQIAEEDPWSGTTIQFPGENAPNTRVVCIGIIKLNPHVICPGRRNRERKAKGFSKNELLNAGITLNDITSLKIAFDKRRRSSHVWNIEDLMKINGE